VTTDQGVIRKHVFSGSNVGLVCGPESGVAVLDFDDLGAAREMMAAFGRIPPTVMTGSGKGHVFIKYEIGLPAKIRWNGVVVGEVQRGGVGVLQQIVVPPSVHPDTGRPYRWLVDPRSPLPELPARWREHLLTAEAPPAPLNVHVPHGEGHDLDADLLLARAASMPGARRRTWGVKFQCPACAAEGHDKHRDNAGVRASDGRFGCAWAPGDVRHRRAIAEVLGLDVRPAWQRAHEARP
jgi:hypothetical protein